MGQELASEYGPGDLEVAALLTEDEEELSEVLKAFWNAWNAFSSEPPFLQELYRSALLVGYWQSIATRRSKNGAEEGPGYRHAADYLAKAEKALDRAIIIVMHLNKQERSF